MTVDVEIQCDGCEEHLDAADNVYCYTCYIGLQRQVTALKKELREARE